MIVMVENEEVLTSIIDKTADHGPLGFLGLGLAATVVGMQGVGLFADAAMVVAMSIFLGGFAQIFAGIEGWKKGDLFGATAFTAFGLFWFSFAFILISTGIVDGVLGVASASSLAYYFLIWGVVSFALLIATFKIGVKAVIVVFITLTLAFFLTALSSFGLGLGLLPAIAILLLGLSSLYTALAIVLNDVYGKTVVPL